MSADTPGTTRRNSAPVAWLFAANAATQFAIQAWLAYGFAKEVWKLAGLLPWLAPVALDIFAITLMAAAYQLRSAPLRQRAYVWVWLAVVIGAQVGAAEGYADHEKWSWWGRIASLFPSIFLAASLHALIIVARRADVISDLEAPLPSPLARLRARRDRRRAGRALAATIKAERKAEADRPLRVEIRPRVALAAAHVAALAAAPEPPKAIEAAPEPPATEPPGGTRRERRARRPRPQAARSVGRRDPRWGDVIKRCLDAVPPEDAKSVAEDLGVVPRTAQLWVKAERAARASVTSRSG